MTHDRFGVRVLIVGIGVAHTFVHQVAESAVTEQIAVATGQIAAQRVHRDLQHQTGFPLGSEGGQT